MVLEEYCATQYKPIRSKILRNNQSESDIMPLMKKLFPWLKPPPTIFAHYCALYGVNIPRYTNDKFIVLMPFNGFHFKDALPSCPVNAVINTCVDSKSKEDRNFSQFILIVKRLI